MKIGIEINKRAMKKAELTKPITEGEVFGLTATVHQVRGEDHIVVVFDHNYKEAYVATQGAVLQAILNAKRKEIVKARRKVPIEESRTLRKAQIEAENKGGKENT